MSPRHEYMFIIDGNKIATWQQYDSMIAVELRGVHIYIYKYDRVHVVVLRVCTQFYYV